MKQLFLFLLVLPCIAQGQSCCGEHLLEQFSTIVQSDSVYAQNQTTYTGTGRNLSLRIYDAVENNCPKRPLLILVHGGAFGGGNYDQMGNIAGQFARRGYVVISAGYRTGFVSSGPLCPIDTAELIRACYRGIQDIRGAIRWSKDRHEQLRIDTNLVFLAGWSAGAYISSSIAYLDLESEQPAQTLALNDITQGNNTFSRPNLGSVQGSISLGNHSASILGFASFSGAFLFPQSIPEGTKPAALFFNNKRDDYSVPYEGCDNDLWLYNCPDGLPSVCGVEAMISTFNQLEIPLDFAIYDTAACAHSMHQPCFPFFLEEMEIMAVVFQNLMSCNEATGIEAADETQASRAYMIETGTAFIPWDLENDQIDLLDSSGNLMLKTSSQNQQLQTSFLKPGIYFLVSKNKRARRLVVR